jgi:hypothetical protein
MAEVLLRADRLDDAGAQAERARSLTQERGERGLHAWALYLLAEISALREPLQGEIAENHYHHALVVADEVGLSPLGARCHHGLGKLYLRRDKRQEAQKHLAVAATMLRQMDMRLWLEQVEAEQAALS